MKIDQKDKNQFGLLLFVVCEHFNIGVICSEPNELMNVSFVREGRVHIQYLEPLLHGLEPVKIAIHYDIGNNRII